MNGTFKVIDGQPYVIINENKLELLNVTECTLHHIDPKISESKKLWSIIPLTDSRFWNDTLGPPMLINGQRIDVEQDDDTARVVKIVH